MLETTLTQALEDILDYIAHIERFVAPLDEAQFRHDDRTVFAVQYALAGIGAVAMRLGEWAAILSPDVPWPQIRSLERQLRPGRGPIDPAALWRTAHELSPLQFSAMLALTQLEDHERLEWL